MNSQMIKKVFPHTYTGNSFQEFQNLLKDGWRVVHIVLSVEDNKGSRVYDYILEKQNQ